MSDPSIELLKRWQKGDQQAASDLFNRFADRLIALARSRISDRLAGRLDPEEVVQSACRSFFGGARAGRYNPLHDGGLWNLLVAITLNKLRLQVRRNQVGKRSLAREEAHGGLEGGPFPDELLAREPTPLEAVAFADELEQLMRSLRALDRRMLEMRLQGHTLDEIATATDRTERTVRRTFEQLRVEMVSRERAEGEP